MFIKIHKSIKFPITRIQAARLLKRPASTIRYWTRELWLSRKDFELLKIRAESSIRKIKPAVKKKSKTQLYYVPVGQIGIVDKDQLEMHIFNNAIQGGDIFYEVGQKLTATTTIALKKV